MKVVITNILKDVQTIIKVKNLFAKKTIQNAKALKVVLIQTNLTYVQMVYVLLHFMVALKNIQYVNHLDNKNV